MKPNALPSLRAARGLFLTFLLGTLLACTTSGRTVFDRQSTEADADFSQMKTYRWDFAALGKLQPDGSHLPEFDRVLCEHVDKHLADKGYRRIDKGNADFSLDYRVVLSQEEAAVTSNGGSENDQRANEYGLRWSFDRDEAPSFKGLQAPKDQTVIYQNGTLHLAAFNPQGETIWHSTASRILSGRGNEAERRAALRVAVNKLMDKFPASKAE